ncbi:MAG: hypothetical protein QXL94_07990 [Candidatus Parvarchaeum sp.]
MSGMKYREKLGPLVFIIKEKTRTLDSIIKAQIEQVSLDSQSFEKYGLLPNFKKIYEEEYIDSLFLLRKLVGRDILVSDLKKLEGSRKNGTFKSYLDGVLKESGNCAVYNNDKGLIEYFLPVRNEINKFYISNERITFFSGASFYLEKSTRNFYDYSKINEQEVKLGELILSRISQEEANIKDKKSL